MGIYQRLGVRPFVNARGTISAIGGSIPHPEVVESMLEASRSFVSTYELEAAVGRRLAELTHNEAAFVSAGAAAGLLLAAAAVMAGADERRRAQLPNTDGLKDEAIALAVNPNPYHLCVRPSGMKVRWVGNWERPTADELAAGLGPKTACCLYFVNDELADRQLPLGEVVRVCHEQGVPVIVDAAAQMPPFSNTWRFTRELGADLAIFSGGKGFRGPQSSGLLVGTREMIERVSFFCPPIHSVARGAKASREQIVGLLTAVEIMARRGEGELFAEYDARLETLYRRIVDLPGLVVRKRFGTDIGKPFHHLRVQVDAELAGIDRAGLLRALDEGEPRIAVGEVEGEIMLNAETLLPGEETLVADRIAAILGAARAAG